MFRLFFIIVFTFGCYALLAQWSGSHSTAFILANYSVSWQVFLSGILCLLAWIKLGRVR